MQKSIPLKTIELIDNGYRVAAARSRAIQTLKLQFRLFAVL